MKIKILVIGIILMMLSSTLIATAKIDNDKIGKTTTNDTKEIRVAIYSMGADTYASTIQIYFDIFDDYQWRVGNKTYKFTIATIDDEGIFKGELNTKNYDVFTIDYAEAQSLMLRLSHYSIKNIIWKNKITAFVEEGGGYFGHCAGAIIASAGLSNRPESLIQKIVDKGTVHISQVKAYYLNGAPFLAQLSGHPEEIGPTAYYFFSGMDENNESAWFGGCCLDVIVDKNNPVFKDICGDTRRILWVAGPALVPPEQSNSVKVIANYPSEEISNNKSTQIHAWKYTGRMLGFLKGFFSMMNTGINLFDKFYFTPLKAIDWTMTDKIIQTNLANKPLITMETYPNENQARIILSSCHPEERVWWGGHIEEAKDTSENNLFKSLNHWTGIDKVDYTYNWCIVRREAAWAAKVPDNDLPPVYGASQASDIYPYNQSSNFTINGNAKEESEGIISLNLYYRYSDDNASWSEWTLYKTDEDSSNGWSWRFNSPDGNGYYEFYSIRKVEYERYIETETVPPGADASVFVEIN